MEVSRSKSKEINQNTYPKNTKNMVDEGGDNQINLLCTQATKKQGKFEKDRWVAGAYALSPMTQKAVNILDK
jgi:hypothetical protein